MKLRVIPLACAALSLIGHYALFHVRVSHDQHIPPDVGAAPLHIVLVPPPAPPAEPEPELIPEIEPPPELEPEPVPEPVVPVEELPPEEEAKDIPPDIVTDDAPELITITQEELDAASEAYWDVVRRQIAARLRVPLSVRRAGRADDMVVLRLRIDEAGQLDGVESVSSTARSSLVRAAVQAVREAAPFPPPPVSLGPPVEVELPIRFEVRGFGN